MCVRLGRDRSCADDPTGECWFGPPGRGRRASSLHPKPWREPPEHVGEGRFLIPDDGAVFVFDARAGKELARYTLPGPESLTGELPRFRIHQGDPLLLIDRNHGVEVDRLGSTGSSGPGTARPSSSAGRSTTSPSPETASSRPPTDVFAAHGWKDGNPLWEAPLPELPHGKWKLAVAPPGLLVYPAEAVLRHPGFDAVGEFRQAGWDGAALLRAAGRTYDVWADRDLPVLVLDPADGRLVQRLTFPAAGPAAGVAVTPKGVVVVTGGWTLTAEPVESATVWRPPLPVDRRSAAHRCGGDRSA